ncbi:MAG TPA: T9SS type A sorting domain-containing protein [Chitinophagales bacterium]|nr:T9SS type A sorting domain-containing protein [Chitinophagales bacterium]
MKISPHLRRSLNAGVLLSCFSLIMLNAHAQIPDTINTNPVTELQTVETPANTFITALMINDANYHSRTVIFRSTDNGVTWDSVFNYGADADFYATPDPVLTVDTAGNIYLVVMRHLPVNYGFIAHLWLFRSEDDGLTWTLESTPSNDATFADFPSITSLGDGLAYLSYTHYESSFSYVQFIRSFDGGSTWNDTSIFETLPGPGWTAVGSDLGFTKNNKLFVSFGDYNLGVVYYASSNDSGLTWTPVQNAAIDGSSYFNITKIVSNKNFSHLGIIAHQPHYLTNVYYINSLDTGNTWQAYQTVSTSSAYCEGVIDDAGNVNLIYNEDVGIPRLCYRYSTDDGQSFGSAMTLLSWTSVSLTAGEYQSILLGNDGLFHVTYVDWNQGGAAKHLIFAPLATDIYTVDPSSHAPRIFPNPVHDMLTFQSDDTNAAATFDLINSEGKVMMSGKVNLPFTSVNVSSLAAGVYLLRVTNGNLMYVQKVVRN